MHIHQRFHRSKYFLTQLRMYICQRYMLCRYHRITKIVSARGDAQVASDQNLERTRVSDEETNCILSQFGMRNSWLARLCWQKHGTKGVAEHALQLKSIQHRHGSKSYDKFSYKIAHLIPRAINSILALVSDQRIIKPCIPCVPSVTLLAWIVLIALAIFPWIIVFR